jgi:hypothetical protein
MSCTVPISIRDLSYFAKAGFRRIGNDKQLPVNRSQTFPHFEQVHQASGFGGLNLVNSDRDPPHRDKELLVNPLSLYRLHIWWGAYRMYLRMRSVLQGHNELEAIHNPDA